MKSDTLQYELLYIEGDVYTSTDYECLQPIVILIIVKFLLEYYTFSKNLKIENIFIYNKNLRNFQNGYLFTYLYIDSPLIVI